MMTYMNGLLVWVNSRLLCSATKNGNWGSGVGVGGAGVAVGGGGAGVKVAVGGAGVKVAVGGTGVKVCVGTGVGVSVGIGVLVGVGVMVGVGVQSGVAVNVGRGVLVGAGVAVGSTASRWDSLSERGHEHANPPTSRTAPARRIIADLLVMTFASSFLLKLCDGDYYTTRAAG
jgi:hypothetical protein